MLKYSIAEQMPSTIIFAARKGLHADDIKTAPRKPYLRRLFVQCGINSLGSASLDLHASIILFLCLDLRRYKQHLTACLLVGNIVACTCSRIAAIHISLDTPMQSLGCNPILYQTSRALNAWAGCPKRLKPSRL
eukprot:4164913-Amphidinium_carterae.2